jgi:uncharacterized protein (TIGR00251 family)
VTIELTGDTAGVRLPVKVVPGAARDRIVGALGSALKVQVAAPPEQGKANARLCALLAEALGVPARSVQVVSGHGSARKVVVVHGLDVDTVRARLLPGG